MLGAARVAALREGARGLRRGSARCTGATWSAGATRRCSTSWSSRPGRTRSRCSAADFVTTEDGTGVVHMAPGVRRGRPERLQRGRHPDRGDRRRPHPVHRAGARRTRACRSSRPTSRSSRDLKERGVVLRHDAYTHSYPHCWRCDTPLVYKAVSSLVRGGDAVPGPDGRAQPADHLDAGARQGRLVRQVAGQRPRLVDQPQPVLGLADPGVEVRRPELPAGRRLRLARRAGARLRGDGHRPAPAVRRRADPAEPGRPDRAVDHAPGAGGARLLVRVRVDAVRPGALPVRERATGSSTTTRATSSSSTSGRPAAGSTPCTCWPPRCSTGRRSATA